MKILAIDTSSSVCSIALLEDLKQIKELNIIDTKTHSEKLMPLIEELLSSTNYTLKDIELIACDKGPGSFTGIRIGISSVKAMAEVFNIPVIGVSSLDGLAYNENVTSGVICPMIDSRNDNVYTAVFDNNYSLLSDYLAININELIDLLKQKKHKEIMFIGTGSVLHENLLKNELSDCNLKFSGNNILSATNIGKSGFNKFKNGEKESADTILPLYINKSQAERMQDLKNGN